jgi:hypothetical protein
MGSPSVKHLSADGATTLQQKNWGAFAASLSEEVDSVRLKFAIENNGTRALGVDPFTGFFLSIQQIGTNDGYTFVNFAPDTNGTISKPWGAGLDAGGQPNGAPTAVDDSAGGSGWGSGAGTKGVVVTAKNATGETIASNEAVFNVSDVSRRWRYSWFPVPGATKYEIYRTDTPGTYGASTFRAENIGNGNVTFLDDGGATSAGTPPADNTTGGAGPTYGTPPPIGSFTQAPLTVALNSGGGFAVGQQFFYWAALKIPAGTGEEGNTRSSRRLPQEI